MSIPNGITIPDILPGEGTVETITRIRSRIECDHCENPAVACHNYLVEDGRRNPASSAFGRDDCSYCSDAVAFACKEHVREVEKEECPLGMRWSSTFYATERNAHMFLRWITVGGNQ